jgi:Ca-activated chloride channel family protein
MRFGEPMNFWLLFLVPALAVFFVWAFWRKRRAMERFAGAAMLEKLIQSVLLGRQYLKSSLTSIGMLFLALALTAPQWGAKLAMAQRKGVDVVVALDVSRSMLAEDTKPNRLARAKHQIGELLDRLEGDRVGLVVFAGQAFVQCPLTFDYGAVRLFLDVVNTNAIPVQGTAIGDAIRLASGSFEEGDRQHKVIVLFTDGEDLVSAPLTAAETAAATGVRIFAVGLGTPTGELIPTRDGDEVGYHKDKQGNYVKTRLDEETLRQVALVSDGGYFRSSLRGAEIAQIYQEISEMDQKEMGSTHFTEYEERYQIPLALALLCFVAEALVADRRRTQDEWKGRFA